MQKSNIITKPALKLIHMLINRAKGFTQRVVSTYAMNSKKLGQCCIPKITMINKFSFGKWNRERIIQDLIIDINQSQTKRPKESPQDIAYFKKLGWDVKYDQQKTLFTFSKVDEEHQYRALTHAKYDPPNDPTDVEEEIKQNQNSPTKKLNIAQILIFVKRREQTRWMVAQFGVIPGSVELMNIFFQNIQPSTSWQKHTYPGPQLATVPEELVEAINFIFINAGMTTELIMNMVLHSSNVIDEIDQKWLTNIKDFWL